MSETAKVRIQFALYMAAFIGLLDMAGQAITCGELRIIKSILTAIVGPQ